MFWRPANAASSFLTVFLFIQSHIVCYCQAHFDAAFSYSMSGMTPLPAVPMGYAHAQPMYHLPQDKTEVIVVGDRSGKQEHHHHHHHHHKNVHHHHHGHQHSHGHNHNHDHKHDHGHKHDHNHNHKHDHNHDHKHAHGHNHHHNHAHGHQHKHGHLHGHKHAHILLYRQLHGHRQKHSQDYGPNYNINNNYGNNNGQHRGNSYEQHHSNQKVNGYHQDQLRKIHQQNNYGSELSNQFPSIKQQHYSNKYASNNHQHKNLQNSNYDTKYPDHVPPSYVSADNYKGISHNEDENNGQQAHNFKVHYDKDDVQQSHYEHSASNENASYESKQEDNHPAPEENSHSSENIPDTSGVKFEEGINKSISSSEQDDASSRFTNSNFNNTPLTPSQKNNGPRFRNSNVPKDHDNVHRHEQNSDELSVEPQVHYGVRLGQNGYNDYQKKEASISTVTFLQENGELITVGDDDPFVSVGRPLKLEDSDPQASYHGESLESKLSAGRMTLREAHDYKATIGKVDEVFNIPLFD